MNISEVKIGDKIKLTKSDYTWLGIAKLDSENRPFIQQKWGEDGVRGYILDEKLPIKWDKIEKI